MKMKRLAGVMLAVAAVLLATYPSFAQATKSIAKSAPDADFKKLIAEYYAAWSSLNPNNAEKYYAKDAGLVFYDIAPLKYNSWAEYKDGVMKAFVEPMLSAKLTPNDDLKVNRRGALVWTTVTFHLSAKPKAGGSMEVDGRHTAIWEKRGAKWVIVHEHVSAPLPG